MKIETTNKQVIEDVPYGCYVWQCPDGEFLGDGEHFMLVFATKGDTTAIKAIADAARHYGYPEGKAVWWSGVRPVSDEEYESQLSRAEQGLIPDPLDIAAIKEEAESLKRGY